MTEDQRRESKFIFLAGFGILMLLWLASSWLIADQTLKVRTQESIRTETFALEELSGNTAKSIDRSLDYLHGIPALVAREEMISTALLQLGTTIPSSTTTEQRRRIRSEDSLLRRINNYLEQVSLSLGVDVVWVTNAAGDCIASSNSGSPESFVGTNYADRDYFQLARKGQPGQQYAMGRKTDIPGLYFSAPITLEGRFAGVAVIKIDLPKLSHWINQQDAFISDDNGVIILARDPALEMRSLPGAAISGLSETGRNARYKRTDFPPLTITPWGNPYFPSLRQFDQEKRPLLISSRPVTDEGLEIHTFKRLPFVADFERERLNLFLLIGTTGALILSIIAGRIFYLRIRKHAELHSAESASLLRTTIESTADGIVAVDNDRHITTCNQRFMNIWHIPRELLASGKDDELLNHMFAQLENPQDFVARVMELYDHPESPHFDILRFNDGTEVERYSFPQWLGSQIVGRVWSFRDVTERRRAEQALRDSHNDLEIKVQERTTDLQAANLMLLADKARQEELIKQLADASNQLLQSEKMASIGQLAAGVAHEINNPVGFVNSNLATLQRYVAEILELLSVYEKSEGEITTETRAVLAELKLKADFAYLRDDISMLVSESIEGVQRVRCIVQDMKEFSHVGESEKQLANIEKGLDSTLNVIWNELKYKTEIVKEYTGIPEIECMISQLNQVFLNLLMNAVQAITERGRITIRTGQDRASVWVEIEDTGSGIPPENLNRIFDPFFTTKPVGKGTGLGLSLSNSIVQKHGGRIELRSELGKGTVFRVVLPMQGNSKENVEPRLP